LIFSYGNFSNLQLIVNYGFSLTGNPWRWSDWLNRPKDPLPDWVTSRCPDESWRPRWQESKRGFPGGPDLQKLAYCERLRHLAGENRTEVDLEGTGALVAATTKELPPILAGGKRNTSGGFTDAVVALQTRLPTLRSPEHAPSWRSVCRQLKRLHGARRDRR